MAKSMWQGHAYSFHAIACMLALLLSITAPRVHARVNAKRTVPATTGALGPKPGARPRSTEMAQVAI